MMSTAFYCAEYNEYWRIDNYHPDETRFVMFREIEGRAREPMVVQLNPLVTPIPGDTGQLSLCPGYPERDILPVLARRLGVTEVCTMFYIERSGSQVMYRCVVSMM